MKFPLLFHMILCYTLICDTIYGEKVMGSKKPHKSSKQERQGMIYVIKKDGTREEFDPQKIVKAVNKSAARILYTFSQEEKDFICRFAQEHADSLGKNEIEIQEMHNIVEGALERVNPAVAKSYRDYRNYKLDFIHMMYIPRVRQYVISVTRAMPIQTVRLWLQSEA